MRIFLYNLIVLLLLSSCASPYVIQLEVQKAPEMYISPGVRSITIVDNSVNQSPYEGHTISYGNKVQRLYQETDSLSKNLLMELSRAFESMGIKTRLIQESIRTDSNYLSKSVVNKNKIAQILKGDSPDLILFLDRGLTTSSLSLAGMESSNAFFVKYDLAYQTDFRFYDPHKQTDLIELNKRSAHGWEHIDWSVDNVLQVFQFNNLREEVLMSKLDQIMKALFPYIITSDRILYCNTNLNMKDALRYAKRHNLNDASIIWQYLYDNSKKETERFYCAMNLAYFYETQNMLSQTHFWLRNAKNFSSVASEENLDYLKKYTVEIENRMSESLPVRIGDY
ncbi:MAG: DUF6340 family protein [Bacteroidales bacterium]